MKMGFRTPSIKKSFKSQTTGKLKRQVKKAVNPMYGKKGMGMINNPKKAIYNSVYNKTTIGVSDIVETNSKNFNNASQQQTQKDIIVYEKQKNDYSPATWKTCGIIMKVLSIVTAIVFGLSGLFAGILPLFIMAIIASFAFWRIGSAWVKNAITAKKEQSDS